MFTCANISTGQASTYYKLDDYYTEKSYVPAKVMGAAADRLGLAGPFDSAKFNAALRGDFEFNGATIPAANRPSLKRAGFDCVFSAPKSVSIEALVHGEDGVLLAHEQAVDAAMREVQRLIRARVTSDLRTDSVHAEGVYFGFLHETSRNIDNALPDPNLHTHNVILKTVVVRDAEGNEKLYALNNEEIINAQKMLDAVYKQELAKRLRGQGYELELTKDGFEIAGYSREQIDAFSKRKNEVDTNLEKQGLSREGATAKQRDAANLKNRNSKKTFSRDEMRKAWKALASNFNRPQKGTEHERFFTAAAARAARMARENQRANAFGYRERSSIHVLQSDALGAGRTPPPSSRSGLRTLSDVPVVHNAGIGEVLLQNDVRNHLGQPAPGSYHALRRLDGRPGNLTADDAVDVAIHHYAQRQVAIKNKYQLIEFAIKAGEFDFSLLEIEAAVERAIGNQKLIIGRNGTALVVAAAYDDEQAIKRLYSDQLGKFAPPATLDEARSGIAEMEASLTRRIVADKEKALGRSLCPDEANALSAKLSEKQVAMIEKIATSTNGLDVIVGDAGTGKSTGMEAAKLILERKGFVVKGLAPSGTAVDALTQAGLETKTVQHAFHNGKYWDEVDEKTVIVLDEAGLVDAETMRLVQQKTTERGARLVIVGDPKQYGSVNRGTAMRQLVELAQQANELVNLDKMQRGRNDFMRSLHFAARDTPEESLETLFKNQMVTAISDDDARLAAIAQMYIDMDMRDRATALFLTGKNTDRIQINAAIRAKLGVDQGVKIDSLEMVDATIEASKMLATYERGDFIKINKKLGDWKAGAMLEVIDKTPDHIVVQDRDGFRKTLHPREFGNAVSVGGVEEIEIAKGERIRFTAGNQDLGVINGDRGEVLKIDSRRMTIRLDRSGQEIILPIDSNTPLSIRYAYSQTGHSAQGATAKLFDQQGIKPNVVLCTNAGDTTIDAASWYTNITRAADKVHVVTNAVTARQIDDLRKRISRRKEKDTANDLLFGESVAAKADRQGYLAPAAGERAWQRLMLPIDADRGQILSVLKEAVELYGERLFVGGTKAQQKAVAVVAGKAGLQVRFDDKGLETTRKYHAEKYAERLATNAIKRAKSQPLTTRTGGETPEQRARRLAREQELAAPPPSAQTQREALPAQPASATQPNIPPVPAGCTRADQSALFVYEGQILFVEDGWAIQADKSGQVAHLIEDFRTEDREKFAPGTHARLQYNNGSGTIRSIGLSGSRGGR